MEGRGWRSALSIALVLVLLAWPAAAGNTPAEMVAVGPKRHAYAAMMYMGTPRDYEFYVATRVMMRSLSKLRVDADLVVIASVDVPIEWVQAMKEEDMVKVVTVENLKNPYEQQKNFNVRFKLTLNKLYAWSLVDYDRVVMLDSDNLFLQGTDELFQCGQFCAVFINPCIFHTGLFVLQPSMTVFNDMLHELQVVRSNPDGADQGFLASYFPDLLDRPMFHPPVNNTKLVGTYRLPLGYQMDASYYYLKLRWSIPCGPNSVITFPSAPWLKPWYWWSWPVLPLGFSWHEQRRKNLGYAPELPIMLIQAAIYVGIIAITRLARPNLSKLCYNRRSEKSLTFIHSMYKVVVMWSIIAAYTVPFFLIPRTIHPVLGWSLYLLGVAALASIAINSFLLAPLPVLTPWFAILGALGVMANPWYSDGVVRALAVFAFAFCSAPVIWIQLSKVMSSLQMLVDREAFFTRLGESGQMSEINKLY
ncbi:putative glucuronosyltransferase PGSIP8 [Phalaenopsis equestris]|uniref:putative glucuronosyltransferase PGSIP8 n=1 Tax=Phalaenopsis equestris TaxID=78828 RepID=UPI0009E4D731|nr:putative glucuronosyltransferase PGSIP8 [Phalaenopsis equestris]